MQPRTTPFSLRSRAVAVLASTLLATGLLSVVAAGPAGAATTALSTGKTAPFSQVPLPDCLPSSTATSVQSFVTGPATPPLGAGSLKFDLTGKDDAWAESFGTSFYDATPLASIENVQYSTYVEAAGKFPPYLRMRVDKDANGTYDESLFFFPSNNQTQNVTPTAGVWQTWDVDSGKLDIDGDNGGTTSLADYRTTNPNAKIIARSERAPDDFGFGVLQGCSNDPGTSDNTGGTITYADKIVVDLLNRTADTYDLEASGAPARTVSISPTSGRKGTTITVTGTDCTESTAETVLGQRKGDSGGAVATASGPTKPDGTFSLDLKVPGDAAPSSDTVSYSVITTCGPASNPFFRYENKVFEVKPEPPAMTGSNGYRMVAADGGIFTFGSRTFHGSTGDLKLNKPIVGGATDTSDYNGYWIVASDGGVFTFNAPFYGSLGNQKLDSPAVEIEPTPTGKGYWIVLANGKVYTFGDANFFGDMSTKTLNKPIIGMSVTPSGKGYWLVGGDGGIFNFGDAGFFGSTGDKKLNSPIVDLAPSVDNKGYYLLGGDGGVFTFGTADFKGSTGGMKLNKPVVAMLVAPNGAGYWLAASDGGVFTFGAVDFLGSMGGTKLNSPVLDLIN